MQYCLQADSPTKTPHYPHHLHHYSSHIPPSFKKGLFINPPIMNQPAVKEIWVQSLDWEDPLEKGKATHSSLLAWRIPWPV